MADDTQPGAPSALLLGRYRVQAIAGEGAFGRVAVAFDTLLGRTVAIKTLKHASGAADDSYYHSLLDRFTREAEAGARMGSHPNLVTVYDMVRDDDGTRYLVLEYVTGGTLASRLAADGPLVPADALRLTIDIARGVQSAHDRGVVHRDIKPANIFLAEDGRAQVGDFGIAQLDHLSGRSSLSVGHPGTLLYMSPEQAQSTGYLHATSDQYSVGLVLFEMLTGAVYKRLLPREAAREIASQPEPLRALVTRMTMPDPSDRYPTLTAAADRARDILRLPPAADADAQALPDIARPSRDSSSDASPPPTVQSARATSEGPARTSRRHVLRYGAGAALVGVGGTGLAYLLLGRPGADATGGGSASVPPATATVAASNAQVPLIAAVTSTTPTPAVSPVPPPATVTPIPPPTSAPSPTPTATIAPTRTPVPVPTLSLTAAPPGAALAAARTLTGHSIGAVSGVAYSPAGGGLIASACLDGFMQVWWPNRNYMDPTWYSPSGGGGCTCVTFTPNGQEIAFGEATGYVTMIVVGTPDRSLRASVRSARVLALAISPDAATIAAALSDATIQTWRIADNTPQTTLRGHEDAVTGLVFLDDRTLASASRDRTARLWHLDESAPFRTLTGHAAALTSIAKSGDGKMLATGSRDATARLWSVAEGSLLRAFAGHADAVTSVALTQSGGMMATGSADTTARLWRVSDGAPLLEMKGHTSAVNAVALSSDEQTLVTGSDDVSLRLWKLR